MHIKLPLEADSQLAESGKPRVCALDHPSVTPKAVFALDATDDSSRDAASEQILSASMAVVTLVGMQFVRTLAWVLFETRHWRNSIPRRLVSHRIVSICSRHGNRHRDALCIDDSVCWLLSLPWSVGFEPVFLVPEGWARSRRRCLRVLNGFGHVRAGGAAWPNATSPTRPPSANRVIDANVSCRCRNQALAVNPPKEHPFAAATKCRSAPLDRHWIDADRPWVNAQTPELMVQEPIANSLLTLLLAMHGTMQAIARRVDLC